MANSSYLAAYCRQYNPHSFDIGQGCDIGPEAQQTLPVPADMHGIPGPISGYVGALVSSRLSIDILRYIGEQRPDWNLVLVAPEDDAFKMSALHGRPNIHFLGAKAPAELRLTCSSSMCASIHRLVNQMTVGNYPRKVDEYLALGKPVVATHTEAMRLFEDHTYLPNS